MTAPYRNDRDAVEDRLAALDKELAALRAEKRRFADVNAREVEVMRESEELRSKLLRARRAATNSLLDGVRVASPCTAGWENMTGDERVRFCGDCKKNVYDLSQMTRAEAEDFVREHEAEGACIRLHRRKDGTIITADCPVGARRVLKLRVIGAVCGAGMVGAAVAGWVMVEAPRATVGALESGIQVPSVNLHPDDIAVDGQMVVAMPGVMAVDPLPTATPGPTAKPNVGPKTPKAP